MAIAPNTQEFFNLKQSVENQINQGLITNQKQLKAFLDKDNIDFDKFMEVDKEYERRKDAGTLTEDTTFDLGKIIGSGVGKVGEDIGQITGDAVEFIAGKEGRETVEGGVKAVANFLDETLPTAITYAAKETIDPRVNLGEDLAAEITAFAAPAAGLAKATKFIKPTTKKGKAAKAGAIGVVADVMSRGEDEQFLTYLVDIVPEVEPLVQRLAIDPDDSVAERRLKQIIDASITSGVLSAASVPAIAALKYAKSGARRLFGRANAQANNITEPITSSNIGRAMNVTVEETSPGSFNQRGKISQVVGKVNTKLGRLLQSTAALPEPIFKSYLRKQQFVQASDSLIRKEAKTLEKLLKKEGTDKALVNRLLMGEDLTQAELVQIPQTIQDVVNRMRLKINNNSILIKDELGLPENSRLAAVLDPERGGAYITRTFEFSTNPKWSKDITKAIKGDLPTTPHNADVIDAVQNARLHLARNNSDLSPEQINALLMDMIERGKKGNSLDILGEFISEGTGLGAAKILKGRKDLDRPILDFLGEVKDPVRNFTETMTNQNKLLAKARYINDVRKFAEDNLGREVKLGGLFPFLPKETTTFLRKGEFGPEIDVRSSIEDLAQKELGAFGSAGETVGLNKFVTTKEFSDMLDKGIDTFDPAGPMGRTLIGRGLQRAAAVGQAMETVFDHTAHLVNTYGMVQQLGMNGILYRPRVAKEAYKAAYSMYQKAAKGDEETLKFLQALKNRGIIDSSVVGENIKRNLDRFGEGTDNLENLVTKVAKAPLRGMSAVYGGVDDFGKIVAFQAEYNAYKKAFSNMPEAELFDKVTETVRNTMPSYTTAAPVVRALSRLPFGTYATFPAEMVRTTKNILLQGSKDIAEGIATNNNALTRIGVRRLAGIGATTAGIEFAINNQNSEMGVSEVEKRAVNLTVPDYQRNTNKVFTQPFYKDPQTGEIMTKFVDSGTLDSLQYIKGPTRAIIGRILAGEEVTQREIDDALPEAIAELYSPFVSEKFLTEAAINAYRGYDEEGNELTPEERAMGLVNVLNPGSIKAGQRYLNAKQSEVLRGEGRGQTAAGFPMRKEDAAFFFATGIRNNTMNLDRSVSYSLYQDAQEINKSKGKFKDYIRQMPDRLLTEEDITNLYQAYVDTQLEKKEAMARMADKANVFRQVEFYEKGKDGKIYKTRYGIDGIVKASTGKGKYNINPNLLYSLVQGPEGQGVFIPDSLNEKEILGLLQDRKFPPSVINGLKRIEAELAGKSLRKVTE